MTRTTSMLMEPGELHANCAETSPSDFGVLMLAPELVVELMRELGWDGAHAPHFGLGKTECTHVQATVSQAIRRVLEQRGSPERHRHDFKEVLHALFAADAFERGVQPSVYARAENERLENVRQLILERWNDGPVPRACLLEVARMAPRTFAAKFTELFGVGPRAYQLAVQLEHAQHLLLSRPDLSILGIAVRCGFTGPELFDRQFRDRFGVTPSEYRKVELVQRPANAADPSASAIDCDSAI
jgi:AraC-like DNA-binding protein